MADAQMPMSLLNQTAQKSGETIRAERVLSLVEDAFINQAGDAVERQFIDNFVGGLTNDQLRMQIHMEQPDTEIPLFVDVKATIVTSVIHTMTST